MGYYMTQVSAGFRIEKENVEKATAALQKLLSTVGHNAKDHIQVGDRFVWHGQNIPDPDQQTFDKLLRSWNWQVYMGEDGSVEHIEFQGEKFWSDEVLLQVLAPYVREGSYIIMSGEEGCHWRWRFSGGVLYEDDGRVVFDKSDSPVFSPEDIKRLAIPE